MKTRLVMIVGASLVSLPLALLADQGSFGRPREASSLSRNANRPRMDKGEAPRSRVRGDQLGEHNIKTSNSNAEFFDTYIPTPRRANVMGEVYDEDHDELTRDYPRTRSAANPVVSDEDQFHTPSANPSHDSRLSTNNNVEDTVEEDDTYAGAMNDAEDESADGSAVGSTDGATASGSSKTYSKKKKLRRGSKGVAADVRNRPATNTPVRTTTDTNAEAETDVDTEEDIVANEDPGFTPAPVTSVDEDTMSPAWQTADIFARIHQTNMNEIAIGQIAVERGQSEEVRRFGERLIRDHQVADRRLMALAREKEIPAERRAAPPEMLAHAAQLQGRLRSASPADFDRTFLDAMAVEHGKTVADLSVAMEKIEDSGARRFVGKLNPILQQHQQLASVLLEKR